MKLTPEAISALKDGSKLRNRLSYEMGCHFSTVDRWINENEENGKLTTVKAIAVITEETGLTMDQIITEETHA